MINLEQKIEEARKTAVDLYGSYIKDKELYHILLRNITKGELIWQIIYGSNTEEEFYKKNNIQRIKNKIKQLENRIKDFQEKYLSKEDMRFYLEGAYTANLNKLLRSYKLGNMDAAYIWGLVMLLNADSDYEYADAVNALEDVASDRKNSFADDAMIVLAEYYKIHGLSEAKSIDESEEELKKSLNYFSKAKKYKNNYNIKAGISTIKAVLKRYKFYRSYKTKERFEKIIVIREKLKVIVVYGLFLVPVAACLLTIFILVAGFGLHLDYSSDDHKINMKVSMANTITLDKNAVYFSKKLPFRVSYRTAAEMNIVEALDAVPYRVITSPVDGGLNYKNKKKNYIIKEGVVTVPNLGSTDLIKKVNLPDSVKIIEAEAFRGWENLESINLPDSITEIGEYAFAETNLVGIDLPDQLKTIRKGMFSNCQNLRRVELPDNLLYIEEEAFYNCEDLEEIILPDTIKEIGAYAFVNTDLESIELPFGIENVDPDNFNNVKEIYVDEREYNRYIDYFNSGAEILIKKEEAENNDETVSD